MGEAQELQVIVAQEAKEAKFPAEAKSQTEYASATHQLTTPRPKYLWWLRMAICTLFVLSGQSISTLLLRLYYEKGGKSKWLVTVVPIAGFPIMLCVRFWAPKNPTTNVIYTKQHSVLVIPLVYVVLGLLLATISMLSSIGVSYIPVSTYSLLLASQLIFNAFFSFFLNSQKFTPLIINSLFLLTISSTLLVVQNDSTNPTGVSKGKYIVGFLCTLFSAAGTGLMLSLTQLSFRKVFKRGTFREILDLVIYESLVATVATLVGLFASGDWKNLNTEMEEFALGKVSYVMTLIWIALTWQVSYIGAIGLIFEVSAIFANVISTLGLPVVPVLAVIVFHDKMNGVKVVSLLLAIWGFVSYVYQHYLDDCESKTENDNVNEVSEASQLKELN